MTPKKKSAKRAKATAPERVLSIFRVVVEFVGIGQRSRDVVKAISIDKRVINWRGVEITTIRGPDGYIHPGWKVSDNGTTVNVEPNNRRKQRPSTLRAIPIPEAPAYPAPPPARPTRRRKKL